MFLRVVRLVLLMLCLLVVVWYTLFGGFIDVAREFVEPAVAQC